MTNTIKDPWNQQLKDIEVDELSRQLRCPNGDLSGAMADMMFASNANMIINTINTLTLRNNAKVLEIGFGSGKHIPELLERADHLVYRGIEISSSMVEQAQKNNADLLPMYDIDFIAVEEDAPLPITTQSIDVCFTVNTVYFWQNPEAYINQLYQLLNIDGQLVIAGIDKAFSEKLPLNKDIFTFYEENQIAHWLKKAGCHSISINRFSENITNKLGNKMNRPSFIVSAIK